eukprot:TRINITY_DN11281_c0_g1_i1.p1 TRINITY_DN11281_c0_g1~~TRINITY_DN11281_c0_g1_i1.p1  ORF type:complete len:510 (+),score=103.44 TRINITY_DN11281_c0_g1_i1:782-2311(+)
MARRAGDTVVVQSTPPLQITAPEHIPNELLEALEALTAFDKEGRALQKEYDDGQLNELTEGWFALPEEFRPEETSWSQMLAQAPERWTATTNTCLSSASMHADSVTNAHAAAEFRQFVERHTATLETVQRVLSAHMDYLLPGICLANARQFAFSQKKYLIEALVESLRKVQPVQYTARGANPTEPVRKEDPQRVWLQKQTVWSGWGAVDVGVLIEAISCAIDLAHSSEARAELETALARLRTTTVCTEEDLSEVVMLPPVHQRRQESLELLLNRREGAAVIGLSRFGSDERAYHARVVAELAGVVGQSDSEHVVFVEEGLGGKTNDLVTQARALTNAASIGVVMFDSATIYPPHRQTDSAVARRLRVLREFVKGFGGLSEHAILRTRTLVQSMLDELANPQQPTLTVWGRLCHLIASPPEAPDGSVAKASVMCNVLLDESLPSDCYLALTICDAQASLYEAVEQWDSTTRAGCVKAVSALFKRVLAPLAERAEELRSAPGTCALSLIHI